MRYGTSHFLSFAAAVRYYRDYFGNDACIIVPQKIRDGEIHIGRPDEKPGQRTFLVDGGTRWAIEDKYLP
jgi:hypothetical protein